MHIHSRIIHALDVVSSYISIVLLGAVTSVMLLSGLLIALALLNGFDTIQPFAHPDFFGFIGFCGASASLVAWLYKTS